jgi:hypothetical protein
MFLARVAQRFNGQRPELLVYPLRPRLDVAHDHLPYLPLQDVAGTHMTEPLLRPRIAVIIPAQKPTSFRPLAVTAERDDQLAVGLRAVNHLFSLPSPVASISPKPLGPPTA